MYFFSNCYKEKKLSHFLAVGQGVGGGISHLCLSPKNYLKKFKQLWLYLINQMMARTKDNFNLHQFLNLSHMGGRGWVEGMSNFFWWFYQFLPALMLHETKISSSQHLETEGTHSSYFMTHQVFENPISSRQLMFISWLTKAGRTLFRLEATSFTKLLWWRLKQPSI